MRGEETRGLPAEPLKLFVSSRPVAPPLLVLITAGPAPCLRFPPRLPSVLAVTRANSPPVHRCPTPANLAMFASWAARDEAADDATISSLHRWRRTMDSGNV